jgi:ABC-type polysaccharide transport system permease subunit
MFRSKPEGSNAELMMLNRFMDIYMNTLVIKATRKLVAFFITLTLGVQQNQYLELDVVKFI